MPAVLVALSATVLMGCIERPSVDGVPSVPDGFGERVPDVPLSGYIYMTPPGDDATIKIDTILMAEDGTGVPWKTSIDSIALWLSPIGDDEDGLVVTIRFTFGNQDDAVVAAHVLASADVGVPMWVQHNDRDTEITIGSPGRVQAMREELEESTYVSSEQLSQTDMWRNALSLPQAPPRPVIAAGFTQLSPERIREVVDWLFEQGIVDLTQFGAMLVTFEADNVVFAVYGDAVPPVNTGSTLGDFAASGLTGLAIVQTQLPAPLVSWGFNVGALRAGMDRVELSTGRHYRYESDGAIALAQVRKGNIQLAVATNPLDAAQILELIPD